MKRKLLCLLLCISMILPNVPIAVHADEAATCEHMEVSEDGTVSGNGVCEICAKKETDNIEILEEGTINRGVKEEEVDTDGNDKLQVTDSLSQNLIQKEMEKNNVEDNSASQTEEEIGEQKEEKSNSEDLKAVSGNEMKSTSENNTVSENSLMDTSKNMDVTLKKVTKNYDGIGSVNDVLPKRMAFFALRPGSFTWPTSNKYYDQLDEDSKAVYDTLKMNYANGIKTDQVALSLIKAISVEGDAPVGNDAPAAVTNIVAEELDNIVSYALLALLYDEPTMSWLVNVGYSQGWGYELKQDNGKYEYTANNFIIQFKTGDNTSYTLDALSSAIQDAKNRIGTNSGHSVTVKAIHDYICETVSYVKPATEENLKNNKYQTVHSALVDGKVTVCAGYAKAFKVLCDSYNIPCILVSGMGINSTGGTESHMWNYVQLDGSWYAVDCTWDDQESGIKYDYFLSGSDTLASSDFGGSSFSYSHIPSGRWSDISQEFKYPSLSSEKHSSSTVTTSNAMDIVYISGVEDTDKAVTGNGTEGNPYNSLSKALQVVKEGGTIKIVGSYSTDQPSGDPGISISKNVTITGGEFTNNMGGFILGADVTFKDININMATSSRNAIIANGHTLVLENVISTGTYGINVFCGAITEPQYSYPEAGVDGKIILKGGNRLKTGKDDLGGNLYAGNFSDLGKGESTVPSHFQGDATIEVQEGATGSINTIGDIYAYGAREDREDGTFATEMWTGNNIEENYKVKGDITLKLYHSVIRNVYGATDKKAHVIFDTDSSKGMITGTNFYNIGTLEINGDIKPSALNNGANIILNAGAALDLTSVMTNNALTINNFIGAMSGTSGILTVNQNSTLTISGLISGTTNFQTDTNRPVDRSTSGSVLDRHNYIIGNSTKNGEEFIFTPLDIAAQQNAVLDYQEGKWTAKLTEEELKITKFEIADEHSSYNVTKSEINGEGIKIPVECEFDPDEGYLYWVPLTIKVKLGSQDYSSQNVAEEDFYEYCFETLGIYVAGNFDDSLGDIIEIGKCRNGHKSHDDIVPGIYTITITAAMPAGNKTETITLTVTDDTQVQVPDAEFNPSQATNGWYPGLSLHAPDGYEIATGENGVYEEYIEVTEGEYDSYNYWLKNTADSTKTKKTISNLKVDDTAPVISQNEVFDITTTTAKVSVAATDQCSGLNENSYSLEIESASNGIIPRIDSFSGTKDGGFFEISGMTANETYVFNLIVGDVAGNEAVEEVTIVAGKNNLSSGQLSVKNGTTYIYDGTELKPGADQLVLTINGQPISLNDADYTYTYSNNINVGSNARVTVTATDSNTAYSGAITGTFTIGSRPITITPKSQTIRNGHQIQTGVGQVDITNHVSGHTLEAITLSQDNTKKKIEASNAVIKDTTQKNVTSNYQITYNEGNLTIVDPVITIQVKNNIVYDGNSLVVGDSGTQNDVTYTLKECSTPVIKWYKADAGGIKGEEFTGTPKDAGNYIIEISATVDNNLGTVTTEKQVTIQKVPLTATVSNKTLTYGDMFSQPGNTVTYSGFVGSDSAETVITGGTPQFSTNYVQYQNKGTYNITADLSAISAVNYEIKVVPGTLTVTPRQATLTWNNYENRIYGDGKSVTATISNLVNNDKVTVAVSGADATEVGTHTATATGLMGEKAGNYTLSAGTTQNYIIAKATAPTNVTAQRNVKWSKGGTETFAVTDFSLPANVNNPKITKVTKNMGETADDLGIFANNSQVVNGQVSLSLIKPSIYKEGQKGVFDVTITSDTHEDITAKLILNIIDREVVDSNLTLSVANITYGQLPAPKGSFSGSKATNVTEVYKYSKDGTAYQELDSLKNTSGFLPAGDYSVQYSYTDDEQIGTKTAAFRVEKKELNIRFDVEAVTKEYDGTTSVPSDKLPTLIIKEAVGSEQPKLVNTGVQFTYDSIQAGEGKTIQVTGLSLDTSESVNDNYTVQSTVSSVGAIITPKKATVLPKTAYTKQYGEKDPVLEYKVTGLIGQDTLEGVLKRASGENVGSYSYDISGLKNQNYKVELDAYSSKFDITKAEAQLTLEADLAAQKAGGKVRLAASAKSKEELEVSGAAQPTAAELTGVSFTEKEAGVFEGIYTIPENAKVGDKITVTVTLKDANYKEVAAKTVIQVIEEELQALPVPQEKPEAEGDKKPSYKLAMEQGISKVPDGLKKLGHLDTVEEIRDALKLEIKKLHSEITDATSAIYDVTLWYHPGEDDSVWQKADKNHWPKSGKITVVLPYPEGTGKNTHNFNVTHMFTVEMNNNKPGTFEYPQVTKTDQGISFQVSGLSPITLGWTRIQEAPAPNPGSGNSTGGSSDSSEDSSSATTTTAIKRQEVKKEEAKATDTTAVAVAKEPGKQKNTKVTVKKEEKEVADNNVVSEKPEATQQTEDAVKEITEEVQEIEGIEEASEVPQDTTQKVQEETKSSSVLWIAAIVALAAAGVVSFILWKNKKNEEA